MSIEPAPSLSAILHRTLKERFGFADFRPFQEEVCLAAAQGKDSLLVMPTGAGKSLCYQLPGLVRAGTTLVISPLLALIEDQVAKLKQGGFRAERIHSGRDRESSREVCGQYLSGELDYLFIAPERLAVPGFIEMLARRKPGLIAVDEAHCISQWGHDFRPEYRMLGQRLPMLRPAPIIALTATATPRVQDDIIAQLGTPHAERFIRGFRRTNLAIEVVELNPGERIEAVGRILAESDRRPAIIYAPTRKRAEETADALKSRFKIEAYHAGLIPAQRERIQTAFIGGKLDVIVATIAFGMGIDKADVRTVVHLALPASVEGYYQEIGRAGRDGKNSRAVLMHAFIDRRTHEFFQERDYPEIIHLKKIYAAVGKEAVDSDELRSQLKMDAGVFEKSLEKLWIHGGVRINADQGITRTDESPSSALNWVAAYQESQGHRIGQLDQVARYAQGQGCRMVELVRYFGDRSDHAKPCGICDACEPGNAVAGRFKELSSDDEASATQILRALYTGDHPATGKLHRDLFEGTRLERQGYERLLSGLARAQLVVMTQDSFVKDEKTIYFNRIRLTHEGANLVRQGLKGLSERVRIADGPAVKKTKTGKSKKHPASASLPTLTEPSPELVAALKAWRKEEAKAKKVPAFCVISDRVLLGIAQAKPLSSNALLGIHGMGPKLAEKYGSQIIKLIGEAG